MLVSELIEKLQEFKEEFGDLEVRTQTSHESCFDDIMPPKLETITDVQGRKVKDVCYV